MSIQGLVGYEGLVKPGYKGLDILRSTAFLRPVQIMRQFISNLGMGISPLWAYHNYKGLSSPAGARVDRRYLDIPIGITNHISGIWGYKGLADIRFEGLKDKRFGVFLFSNVEPCKSMIENQKYKIVKGAI